MAKKRTATEDELGNLHKELARLLKEAIQPEPIKDETGKVIGSKINASALNVARQFLKDNNITTLPDSPALKGVLESLPDFGDDPTLMVSAAKH